MDWRVQVAAHTDVGPQRAYNEDAIAVLLPDAAPLATTLLSTRSLACDRGVGLLVLDGMGGQYTGDVPCRLAVESLAASFASPLPTDPLARGAWLVEALRRADGHVQTHVTPNAGQAATVVLALVHGDTVHVTHVGDARAYLLRDGRLEPCTRDDSLLNRILDEGHDESVLGDLPRGLLTQALGFPGAAPHLRSFPARAGDVLLLCSDGLHGFVAAEAIAATLREIADPAGACAALVATAVAARSTDNISVLVARVERGA
jgi:protein phosphatase